MLRCIYLYVQFTDDIVLKLLADFPEYVSLPTYKEDFYSASYEELSFNNALHFEFY